MENDGRPGEHLELNAGKENNQTQTVDESNWCVSQMTVLAGGIVRTIS